METKELVLKKYTVELYPETAEYYQERADKYGSSMTDILSFQLLVDCCRAQNARAKQKEGKKKLSLRDRLHMAAICLFDSHE